jgi:hypothetical protein
MPKGHRIELNERRIIFRMVLRGCSADSILEILYDSSDIKTISKNYLINRINFFLYSTPAKVAEYLSGGRSKGGRKRKYDAGDDLIVKEVIDTTNTRKLWAILQAFAQIKGINVNDASLSAIYRAQKRLQYSLKGLTRIHIRQNPAEALQFFSDIQHFHEDSILNFDAANTESGDNLQERCGRSVVGERAIKIQIVIKGVAWSFLALYSTIGFLSWRYFAGTISNECVSSFLRDNVKPFFSYGSLLVCDNASVHKHNSTIATERSNSRIRSI